MNTANTKQIRTLYAGAALLSAAVFIGLYGIKILSPVYTDWLMAGGDLTQHYLGWKGFRLGVWQFPPGLTNMLSYPDSSSVIFTDSIPLVSFVFKLLSPLLPSRFQFFGIYGLVCFVLSGVLASDILSRYSENRFAVLACSVFFVCAPFMVWRMYFHTALASQWIILLALRSIFLYEERYQDHPRRAVALFGFLGLLAGSIHIYYVVFCGFVLVGYWIMDITYRRSVKNSILCALCYGGVFAVTVYLMGGLSYYVNPTSDGLESYSMNLNSFFNPMGWSAVLHDMPVLNAMQKEECLCYLGLGMLGIMIAALVMRLWNHRQYTDHRRHKTAALITVFVLSLFFALSSAISFNDKVIFEYELPWILTKAWSVFRATGRFAWLPAYILMLETFRIILRNKKAAPVLLAFALALQLYDLFPALSRIHTQYADPEPYESLLQTDEFWETIGDKPGIRHLIFTDKTRGDMLYSFTDFALDHGMTVNLYYFARSDVEELKENLQEELRDLDSDNLYIFDDDNKADMKRYKLTYYSADGFYAGLSKPVPGLEEYLVK